MNLRNDLRSNLVHNIITCFFSLFFFINNQSIKPKCDGGGRGGGTALTTVLYALIPYYIKKKKLYMCIGTRFYVSSLSVKYNNIARTSITSDIYIAK